MCPPVVVCIQKIVACIQKIVVCIQKIVVCIQKIVVQNKVIVEIVREVRKYNCLQKMVLGSLIDAAHRKCYIYIVMSEQSINSVHVEIRLWFPVVKEDKISSLKCK